MYFIKIESDINSGQIIKKQTTLDSFKQDFEIIYAHLNKNGEYFYELADHKMYIRKNENVLRKGYIYNTKVNVIKNVYTLSLIKCNEELSNLFVKEEVSQSLPGKVFLQRETQTNNTPATISIETQSDEISTSTDTNVTVPNVNINTSGLFTNQGIDSLGIRYTRFQQQQDPFECWNDNSWADVYQPKIHKKTTCYPTTVPAPPTPPPIIQPTPRQSKISNNPFDYFTQDLLNDFTTELKNKLTLPNHGLIRPSK